MAISSLEFHFLQQALWNLASIRLEDGKRELAESRLSRMCAQNGIPSLDQFFIRFRTDKSGALAAKLIEAMTTHETYFFRDVHPFETLKSAFLPEVIEAKREERTLRIWCAACSTGQEPYSIAMLIHDAFPDLLGWKLEILATDLCQETLTRAAKAEYSRFEAARGLSEQFQTRYFEPTPTGNGLRLRAAIRGLVRFEKLNLLDAWRFPHRFDLIFIRNVLIYFEDDGKLEILKQAAANLHPRGFLFLGTSESLVNLDVGLKQKVCGLTRVFHHDSDGKVRSEVKRKAG